MSRLILPGILGVKAPIGPQLIAYDDFNVTDGVVTNRILPSGQQWEFPITISTILTNKKMASRAGAILAFPILQSFDFQKKRITLDMYYTVTNTSVGALLSYIDVNNYWYTTTFGINIRIVRRLNGSNTVLSSSTTGGAVSSYIENTISEFDGVDTITFRIGNSEIQYVMSGSDLTHFMAGVGKSGFLSFSASSALIGDFKLYKL
jgi:hypothetical protein